MAKRKTSRGKRMRRNDERLSDAQILVLAKRAVYDATIFADGFTRRTETGLRDFAKGHPGEARRDLSDALYNASRATRKSGEALAYLHLLRPFDAETQRLHDAVDGVDLQIRDDLLSLVENLVDVRMMR